MNVEMIGGGGRRPLAPGPRHPDQIMHALYRRSKEISHVLSGAKVYERGMIGNWVFVLWLWTHAVSIRPSWPVDRR